jgi:hypothetical protein
MSQAKNMKKITPPMTPKTMATAGVPEEDEASAVGEGLRLGEPEGDENGIVLKFE